MESIDCALELGYNPVKVSDDEQVVYNYYYYSLLDHYCYGPVKSVIFFAFTD